MKRYSFDTIVIGSGTAAYFAIDGLNKDPDYKIAVIDERPFGGTCALRGCQPKKYLVSNAEAIAAVRHLTGRGIEGNVTANWEALQNLKNEFLDGRSESELKQWKKRGVVTFNGSAEMISEDEVAVGDDILQAKNIILATGALPRQSEYEGREFVHDSEFFLNMDHLPERILFIGGGYISFEFAHIAARAGAREVVIMHRSSRPLKAFDKDIVTTLVEASNAANINVVLDTQPLRIDKEKSGYIVHTSSTEVFETDLVIESTGRLPNLTVLTGGKGNVETSSQGIVVNDYLQSITNPRVYAIGDCAATPYMLAPVADKEGQTVVNNIIHGNSQKVDYSVIPSAVFTIPSIGSVGLTEEQVQQIDGDFRINSGKTGRWPSSKRIGEKHGAYKVIIDNTTDLIVGAHIVRHNAAEVINTFALAIKFKIKAAELADFMWAYPTSTSDLKYMVK